MPFVVLRTDHFTNYTSPGFDRLKVDVASATFANGREFRINEEFSIDTGQSIIYKFVVGINTVLTFSSVECDQGGVKYSVWTLPQTTELTPFTTPVSIYRKNNMTTAPVVASQIQIFKGGTATFTGVSNSVLRVRTGSGNANRSSNVGQLSQQRGFPPTTVYLEIKTLDGINTTSTGVFSLEWAEI